MTKYDVLTAYLQKQPTEEVPMTFGQIESLVGVSLPASARKHRPWWSNNPSNAVITHAWLKAGYKSARVDMAGEKLVFVRSASRPIAMGFAEAAPTFTPTPFQNGSFVTQVRLALAGSVTIAPGADATQPTGEVWNAEAE